MSGYKLTIDGIEIAYLKHVQHGSPLIKFVGGMWQNTPRSPAFRLDRPEIYDERAAKMWCKRLAKYGFAADMTAI